jgi:4-hydroxy-tetrahydrodipicolinate reductase
MGSEVARAVQETPDLELVGAFTRRERAGARIGNVAVSTAPAGVRADVLIDFTNPQAALTAARIASESGIAFVTGTTGFDDEQREALRSLAERIAIVAAPNMSVGVNLLYTLVAMAARELPGYDIEITETHHRGKRDAPSGTARHLVSIIETVRGEAIRRYGREGMGPERSAREIGIHAIRAGDIAGEHVVLFAGDGERLELTHRATSRRAFAAGALLAIRFVAARRSGFYDMGDVLQSRGERSVAPG